MVFKSHPRRLRTGSCTQWQVNFRCDTETGAKSRLAKFDEAALQMGDSTKKAECPVCFLTGIAIAPLLSAVSSCWFSKTFPFPFPLVYCVDEIYEISPMVSLPNGGKVGPPTWLSQMGWTVHNLGNFCILSHANSHVFPTTVSTHID